MKKLIYSSGPMLLVTLVLFLLGCACGAFIPAVGLTRLVPLIPSFAWFTTAIYLQSIKKKS